ncbi:hypothetical protein DL96DRAFT_1294727 [Flagelloscypha sp. PMI_526]|nr:hypothetical protein DL96DRAFT_1294727 [Flagelloscypha sp. PMI_526]
MIFVTYQRDFDDLARSVSRLSKLENLLLCLIPPRRELENNAFVQSLSSTRLNTVFFLVDSVHNAEDLGFFDWEAIGNVLLRPEYAGLESVAFDCTGKTDEWVEEAVTWLETNVSGHSTTHCVGSWQRDSDRPNFNASYAKCPSGAGTQQQSFRILPSSYFTC